ncbi:MAG: hypothetical protein J0653_01570 [Deltaproteobacteria bacterium]|nr:hypothetical protein [Deltaproteobacteria bacterium]
MKNSITLKAQQLTVFALISLSSVSSNAMDESIATEDDVPNGVRRGDTIHESAMGNQYRYNLAQPVDKIMYDIDPAAKLYDKINIPVTPSVGIDRSLGEHGGGLITK